MSEPEKRPCKNLKNSKQSPGQKLHQNALDHLLTTYLTTYEKTISEFLSEIHPFFATAKPKMAQLCDLYFQIPANNQP
ncbi:MAG: hypothetical protein E7570_01405 [Ruminococcaceae bacterium]|nr:hypothetical protein [Oscillospiraceae bacterium]